MRCAILKLVSEGLVEEWRLLSLAIQDTTARSASDHPPPDRLENEGADVDTDL